MYKLIIADDEVLVREAIKNQMNWTELGFECAGVYEDGEDALEAMKREPADVVLTDIGMPFMDGLQLTRELGAKFPEAKVIILTGYDDFDYAQQAIKLQAVDYILKPVTSSELGKILLKLREELDAKRSKERDYEKLKREMTESMPILRERFLERLMTSAMPIRQRDEGLRYYRIEWAGPYLAELAIDVDDYEWELPATATDQQLIRFAVFNVSQELIERREGTAVFRDRENRVFALLSGEDPQELQERALAIAEEAHQAITAILPVRLSVGIGYSCRHEQDDVLFAHRTALSALEYHFVIGDNAIIRLSDIERRRKPEEVPVVAWENELVTKLKTGTLEEMDEAVNRLFAGIRESLLPLEICQMYLQRIVLTIMHAFCEMTSEDRRMSEPVYSQVQQMAFLESLDETQQWMLELFRSLVTHVRGMREDQSLQSVNKALEFVRRNLKDPELSLISVCKHISMSPSYFSALFKKNTGRTLIEHVTSERMERAKELLANTSMKSYEVAHEVGYGDPHYFSGVFKKHCGDTPTDYRLKTTTRKA